jgi:hypothetical protein
MQLYGFDPAGSTASQSWDPYWIFAPVSDTPVLLPAVSSGTQVITAEGLHAVIITARRLGDHGLAAPRSSSDVALRRFTT